MSSSATLSKPEADRQKQVYQTPQQVQYLYLEAELDVLLRQLQNSDKGNNYGRFQLGAVETKQNLIVIAHFTVVNGG